MAPEYGADGDFWRFTPAGAQMLFQEFFLPDDLKVRPHGNLLTTIAYLYGLACHELSEAEFEIHDPDRPLIVSVRARTRVAGR